MGKRVGVVAATIGLLAVAVAASASPLRYDNQPTPEQCLGASLAQVDRLEWNVRNAELVLGNVAMNRLLGAAPDYPADQVAEAERTREEAPAQITAARDEIARWRALAPESARALEEYTPAQLSTLLSACASAPASQRTPTSVQTATVIFSRFDGKDAYGNDLNMVEVPSGSFESCSVACAADERCRAFTLYTPAPHDRSFCWLKHTAGAIRSEPDSITGVRPGAAAAPAPQPAAPRPALPALPADCNSSVTGCEFGIVSHMPGYSAQNGYVWSSSGPWQNHIRLFSRPHGQFTRPVTVCGRRLFAGPDQMNKTVQGWLNPLPEALATRFSLQELQTQSEICSWRPGGRGGSLG